MFITRDLQDFAKAEIAFPSPRPDKGMKLTLFSTGKLNKYHKWWPSPLCLHTHTILATLSSIKLNIIFCAHVCHIICIDLMIVNNVTLPQTELHLKLNNYFSFQISMYHQCRKQAGLSKATLEISFGISYEFSLT